LVYHWINGGHPTTTYKQMTTTKTLTFTQEQLWELANGLEAIHPENCTPEEIKIQEKLHSRVMGAWHKLNDAC